jgi:hypothetical protein
MLCAVQMQAERNQAMDRVDMLDTELTAVRANSMGLQGALQKEQQRSAEVELAMVAKDKVGPGSLLATGRLQQWPECCTCTVTHACVRFPDVTLVAGQARINVLTGVC